MRKGIFPAIPLLALLFALIAACGSDDGGDPAPTIEATTAATSSATSNASATGTTTTATTTPAAPSPSPAPATTATLVPSPQPAFTPFPERRADGQTQTDRCGSYNVERKKAASTGSNLPMADIITISTSTGVFVVELKNEEPFVRIGIDWCYDLNADGLIEMSVYTNSGGAHCCTTQAIYTFNGPKSELLMLYEAGNAGSLLPQELDGKAPVELTGQDDRLAYFGDLSYAASPTLVTVFAYKSGKYVDSTKDFPAVVQQYRSQLVALYQTCGTSPAVTECQKGVGLGVMAESLVLGDWTSFVSTLNPPAEVRAWLDANQSKVAAIVAEPKPAS